MDEKDCTIYEMLNEDGRKKIVEIAKVIGFSPPSTKERVEKLIKNKDIKVKALLNVQKKKWKTAVCNIQVSSMEEALKLADTFKNCPRVIFATTMTGAYNLILILVAKDTAVLESAIENGIRPVSSIKKLDISIGEAPILPGFLDIRINPVSKEPPCGEKSCSECYLYERKCDGCPATIYWKGLRS
jgi:DNA-binding Lrp family transcriptional regulator